MKQFWKDTVHKVAPRVADAISGPMGPIAEGVVRRVATEVLGEPSAPRNEVIAQLAQLSPEQVEALKRIEAEMDVELARVQAQDRADAREERSWVTDALAGFVLVTVFGFKIALLFVEVPVPNVGMVERADQLFEMATFIVLGFYFGSSIGSKMKTKLNGR